MSLGRRYESTNFKLIILILILTTITQASDSIILFVLQVKLESNA